MPTDLWLKELLPEVVIALLSILRDGSLAK
jgi:hypothetical protein